MTRRTVTLFSALAVFAALAVCSIWLLNTRYYLANKSGSEIVCNTRECYLFIEQGQHGWRANGFRLVSGFFRAMLGGANSPTDIRRKTTVIAVDPKNVWRYSFPGNLRPDRIYRDNLYVAHSKRVDPSELHRSMVKAARPEYYEYGKWTKTGLQPVDEPQRNEVVSSQHALWLNKGDSTEVGLWRGSCDGWVWVYPLPPDHPVRLDLKNGLLIITASGSSVTTESITVKTPDGREQAIWSLDHQRRRISKEEYLQLFGGGS